MRARRAAAAAVVLLVATACSGDDGADVGARDEAGTTTTVQAPYAGYVSEVYSATDKWICHPDLPADTCRTELDVNVVAPDGSVEVVPHDLVEEAAVDCFYVYPTLNFGGEGNTTFDAPPTELEIGTVHQHAGPFSSLCRVFAPRYRQLTLGGFGTGDRELAYGDVADAFKHYMANANGGRGVVLIGHSQGSGHLVRLLEEEFDRDDTMRELLVSALLIGTGVEVPAGEDVGGDLANVPACRAETQTGCVISYASFRSTSPPPENSFFGRAREGDGQVLCTNPAALAGGAAGLDTRFPTTSAAFADPAGARELVPGFIAFPGLLTGECVERDGFTYLEVTVNADPADPRIDDIGGDLTPEWGLHAVDVALAAGDLVRVVRSQTEAWIAARP